MGISSSSSSSCTQNLQSCQVRIPIIMRPSNDNGSSKRDSLNNLNKTENQNITMQEAGGVGEPAPWITEGQKVILRKTWIKLQKKMDAVGVVSFLRLFETHPETLRPFLHHINAVKEIEMDEWYQEKLRVHALRVMAVVEKTMHRLDCEHRAIEMLSVYGKRHCGYGVTPQMLDLMGESFVVSFQPALEDDWTKECEEAWRQLFKFIVHYMKTSYECTKADEKSPQKCPFSSSGNQHSNLKSTPEMSTASVLSSSQDVPMKSPENEPHFIQDADKRAKPSLTRTSSTNVSLTSSINSSKLDSHNKEAATNANAATKKSRGASIKSLIQMSRPLSRSFSYKV